MKIYYAIPIDLCKYALEDRKNTGLVKLYVYFKMNCGGHFKLKSENRILICDKLNISTRTLKTHIDALLKKNGLLIILKQKALELLVSIAYH